MSGTAGHANIRSNEDLPDPIEQFLSGKILDGCGIDEAHDLTKMMIGAYESVI